MADGRKGTDGVEAFIAGLPDAYTEAPSPHAAEAHLAAMAGVAVPTSTPARSLRRPWRRRVMRVAAAGFGAALLSSGLAYAGVPIAPNPVAAVVAVATTGDPLPDQTPEHAREHKDAVNAYTDASADWLECVKAEQEAREPDDAAFDKEAKEAACGAKPSPHDYGMTGPSSRADDGQQTADDAKNAVRPGEGAPPGTAPTTTPPAEQGVGPGGDPPTPDDHPGQGRTDPLPTPRGGPPED